MQSDASPSVSDSDYTDSSSGDESYLDDRASLRADIAKLIERYRISTQQPFSVSHLIVMAVVSSDLERVSRRNMLEWIVRNFRYYADKVLDLYVEHVGNDAYYSSFYNVVSDFEEAFEDYSLPLIVDVAPGMESGYYGEDTPDLEGEYRVDSRAARVYLQESLEPERKGTFRFLDLPPELRNTIYEMVLQSPASGLAPTRNRWRSEPSALEGIQRVHDPDVPLENWLEDDGPRYPVGSLQDLLAILLVCKQIYNETLTTFYEINTFCLPNTCSVPALRLHMTEKRFLAIKRIFIQIGGWPGASWPADMEALTKQKSYQLLSLELLDHDFLSMDVKRRKSFGRTQKFTRVSQIPGFADLAIAASRAEKFELRGECPLIKAFLDEEIKRLKTGVGKASKPHKKRVKAAPKKTVNSRGKVASGGAKA